MAVVGTYSLGAASVNRRFLTRGRVYGPTGSKAPITSPKVIPVVQVIDSGLPFSITPLNRVSVSQVVETDTSVSSDSIKYKGILRATDTSVAFASGRQHSVTVGLASDNNSITTVSVQSRFSVNRPIEFHVALAVGVRKVKSISLATGTDLTNAVGKISLSGIAHCIESSASQAADKSHRFQVSQLEDNSFPGAVSISSQKRLSAFPITESSIANAQVGRQSRPVIEFGSALSLLLSVHRKDLVTAIESNLSLLHTRLKRVVANSASESNVAGDGQTRVKKLVTIVVSNDYTETFSIQYGKPVPLVVDTSVALNTSVQPIRTVFTAYEGDSARLVGPVPITMFNFGRIASGGFGYMSGRVTRATAGRTS
jgi:hypothetical protein